jgi:hypothetical protein
MAVPPARAPEYRATMSCSDLHGARAR